MRISARLLILEIVAFLAFAVLAGAGLLAWRLSQGPIDLEFIRSQVERSLADARGGQSVTIEKLGLEWVRDRGRVEAVARGFTAMDKSGQPAFRADRAMIAFDSGALLTFKVQPRQLRLEDGAATVVRSADGVWTLADMVLAKEPDAADKPFDPLRDINWTTLATPIRALISAGEFEQVELVGFHLDVDDRKAGNKWSASPVAGVWKANQDGVTLNLDVTLANAIAGEPNHITLALASDGKVERAAGKVTVQGVDPTLIAEMFGYKGEDFTSGKPASATFSVAATERSGLQSTSLALSGVTGVVKVNDHPIAIRDLSFDAGYDPASKKIALKSLVVDSDWAKGAFTGELDAAALMQGDTNTPMPFQISGANFTLDIRPVFEHTWLFTKARLTGAVSIDGQRVIVSKVEAATGELDATASGEVWLDTTGETLQVGVKGQALGTGKITPAQVLDFWPQHLAGPTRVWVRERIPQGIATRAALTIDWPPNATAKGYLPDEHLALEFQVEGAEVIPISDLPPITNVSGVGHLKGNSLTFDATGGQLGSWQLDGAKVNLPRFWPLGATMAVTTSGRGNLGELLRIVEKSQFAFGSRYGLDVNQITGQGSIDVAIGQPIGEEATPEDVSYTIHGGFQQVTLPDLMGDFGLSDANLSFELTNAGVTASGGGEFGPAPVTFEWREKTASGGDGGVELTARARATPDLLNAFGFAARNFMQGEAGVELRATGPGGRDFDAITANVDLTHMQLDVAELGWHKKYDTPAKGSLRYGRDNDRAILTGEIRSDGLELIGEARMDAQGAIEGAEIEHIFSRDTLDLRGSLSRRKDGGYRAAMTGAFFDASPFMDGILDMSNSSKSGEGVGGPGDDSPGFDLQLNVERLKLRPNADLHNARIALALGAEGPRNGTISGEIEKGKALNVSITSTSGVRNVVLTSDDAGYAARVLLNADYLIGGKLTFNGKFKGAEGDAMVTMAGVRLKDAPLVAQLLSLASLQGLADVLSGDGVLFTSVNAPVKFVDGRIDFPGLRATGPAMGLTARGWIAPETGELALDGVLAPSLIGANSLLGGLPIIGDLIVSRQGEGMFAPTYSVRGTFARANISINPVAALAPGVLRRMFENPSEPPPSATASN